MAWQKAKLINSKQLTSNVKSFFFSASNLKKHKSGQYFDLKLTNNKSARSFSVASSPKIGYLEFVIQKIDSGKLSPFLFDLKIGDEIEINGPRGDFYFLSNSKKDLLLIAGGTGIVPFISILRHHYKNFKERKINLIYSVTSESDLLFKNEFNKYRESDSNLTIHYVFTRNNTNQRINLRVLSDLLNNSSISSSSIYIAGSTSFVENIYSNLIKLGFSSRSISRERFGPNVYD